MPGRPSKPRREGAVRPQRPASRARGLSGASMPRVGESNRVVWPLVAFSLLAILLLLRLFYLQAIAAPSLSADAEAARTASYTIEPKRGTIYDRNGTVLAMSVDATTTYANPFEVEDVGAVAAAIAEAYGGSPADYVQALTVRSPFSYIKQRGDVEEAQRLKELLAERELEGVYFQSTTRREYPNGQVGGQIVGACSVVADEETGREFYRGICGLEQQYDDILSGTPGRYEAERGEDGTPIPGAVHEDTPAIDGQDIIISLDIGLQEYVEGRLQSGTRDLNATGGSCVVMDGGTGEIYAAASLPLFNPADRSEVEEGATRLKAVTDLFEPGSIFKSVSTMAILETGSMSPDDTLFCPAVITADGYSISDAHERSDATFSLRQILDQSSNVGISLAVENMGFEELYDRILAYNLHTRTGVDYPGEGQEGTEILGMLPLFEKWSKVVGYNISFGQGVSVTPLQMVRFYGALTNNGVEVTPHFLVSKPQSGETPLYGMEDVIANKDAIPTMVDMLKTVVTDGTGKAAAIEGFEVAGKTSTAEIYDEENGGYRKGVYNLAFTGFLADSSSQLVCFVGANEVPGDGVVTPIFKDIMATAIDRFQITP